MSMTTLIKVFCFIYALLLAISFVVDTELMNFLLMIK